MTRRDRVRLISAGSPSSDYSIARHKHKGWQHSEASAPKDTGIKPRAPFPFKLQVNTTRACFCPFFYLRIHATRCPWLLNSPQSAQREVTVLWSPRSHAQLPVPSTQGRPARQRAGPKASSTAPAAFCCGVWGDVGHVASDRRTQGSPYVPVQQTEVGLQPLEKAGAREREKLLEEPQGRAPPAWLGFSLGCCWAPKGARRQERASTDG